MERVGREFGGMPDNGGNSEIREEFDSEQKVAPVAALPADGTEEDSDRDAMREQEVLYGKKLGKLKKKVDRWRVKQAREAFHIGDLWRDLEHEMPRSSVAAFLSSECQIPRQDVGRYAKLAEVLGDQRDFLAGHGVAVSVLLELARQNETVRREAFAMIRSGRSLQAKELRGLKRDIALAEAARDGRPDQQRAKAFKASALKKSREAAAAWLNSLENMTNDLIELPPDNPEDDNSPETVRRVDDICRRASELLAQSNVLVEPELTAEQVVTHRHDVNGGSWAGVLAALERLAHRYLFVEPDWNWPNGDPLLIDQSLIWDLAWAFGHDRNSDPGILARTYRARGRVPLTTSPEAQRVRAEVYRQPTVLELCAGAGGQALGLQASGFRHIALVEVDEDATATIRQNQPEWPVLQADIRSADLTAHKGVDLLAGGVPCQPFSSAGARKAKYDGRDLFPEALRLIRELEPKAIMLENVTGIFDAGTGPYRVRILAELEALGYDAEWRIVKGLDFGLCQKRRRAILVGFRPGIMHRFRWPHRLETSAPTVGETLRDLMGANGWTGVDNWVERANGFAPTLIGGSQAKKGIDLAQAKSREEWLKIGVNPSGKADEAPGPDAPADHTPKLTLRMMARIQDFPDDWKFSGSNLQQFHQIANAFPPRMARAVGYGIIRALSGSEVDLPYALSTPVRERKRLNLAAARDCQTGTD